MLAYGRYKMGKGEMSEGAAISFSLIVRPLVWLSHRFIVCLVALSLILNSQYDFDCEIALLA
jgi:hypothetical protein